MDLDYHARYALEHKILPRIFYDEGPRLIRKFMLDGSKVMGYYYDRITEQIPSYICPYSDDDFSIHFRTYIRGSESCMVLMIEMPEPENALLCQAIYLCYGTRSGYDLYATTELSFDGSQHRCAWSEEGCHVNLGDALDDPNEEMDALADLFWELAEHRIAG